MIVVIAFFVMRFLVSAARTQASYAAFYRGQGDGIRAARLLPVSFTDVGTWFLPPRPDDGKAADGLGQDAVNALKGIFGMKGKE